jgi:hypothetical protein
LAGRIRNALSVLILVPITPSHVGLWEENQISPRAAPTFSCTTPRLHFYVPYMSFLRRRLGGGGGGDDSDISTPELSREPSPGPDGKRPANLRLITAEQLQTLKQKGKHKKRRNVWVFGLGGIFGLLLAGFFASSNDMIDLTSLENVNLESIMEALPDNFVKSAQQMQVRATFALYRKRSNGRPCDSRGIEADCPNSVENGTRCRKLRFFRRRSPRPETRYKSQTPCHHDSRCHLDGS